MKMVIAIINEKYLDSLLSRFLDENILITKVSSTGGFLKAKNVTIILSIKNEDLDLIKSIFKSCVKSEVIQRGENSYNLAGANIFVMDVERDVKF